jgi:geranylgeranyl diphosphate synthase, type II
LLDHLTPLLKQFDLYVGQQRPRMSSQDPQPLARLLESMAYSFDNGGKRFRPTLSLLTAQTLKKDVAQALPVAYAVELIHTYSLVHDDLPCMDDDDVRRGKPTNHKIYGEALALLAGDGLLTECFAHLARAYQNTPHVGVAVIQLLAEAAGWSGMVGGQVVDIENESANKSEWIDFIHKNKTGALIRASVECSAVACGASETQQKSLRDFAADLGFAFQLADDILDWDPEKPENTSFVAIHGLEKTRANLKDASQRAEDRLKNAGLETVYFLPLIQFNQNRNV